MDNAPNEAPAEAPKAPESEAPQTTTNEPAQTQAQAPDMYGFTSEQLAEMKKFYDANGGFDKVKSRISNPQQFEQQPQQPQQQQTQQQQNYGPQTQQQPTSQQYQQQEPYRPPQGSITPEEFLAQQYFQGLSRDPKYENISEQIASGDVLKEMASFNIQPLNMDGSINDAMVRRYLDLKAQTVPAKPTEIEPNASNAPTVTYTAAGDRISDINQAYKILMEPGNPDMAKAEEFIKNSYNPNSGNQK